MPSLTCALSGAGLCTAMTDANLASTTSVETAFPRLADIMGCSRERLAEQTFDGSTSPRLDSRLARRPKGQFPYALQPFRIMPAPPGEGSNLSVSEANRRLQQAQALSLRQQHFGQLLDLASTGEPKWKISQSQFFVLATVPRLTSHDSLSAWSSSFACLSGFWAGRRALA